MVVSEMEQTGGCFSCQLLHLWCRKREFSFLKFAPLALPVITLEKTYHHCSRGAGNILWSAIPSLPSIRELRNCGNDSEVLLTFMDDPISIRSMIYATNVIEQTIKEIRKRLKSMYSLNSEVAEKIVYWTIQNFN